MLPYLLIAVIGTTLSIAFAEWRTVETYKYAPLLLVPLMWSAILLRHRLALTWWLYGLFVAAILLHNLGAFGCYQRSYLGIPFDAYVHFTFALVGGLIVHRALRGWLPLSGWSLAAATVLTVMGLGALHEVGEYLSYLILGEETGILQPSTSYAADRSRGPFNNLLGCGLAVTIASAAGRPSRKSKTDARAARIVR